MSVEECEFIIDHFFRSFKNALTDARIPKVKLPGFGTFLPVKSKIYRSLKHSIKFYRMGGTTYEYLKARIRRIWPVRNRLIQEENKMITWDEWSKVSTRKKLEVLANEEQEAKKRSAKQIYGGAGKPSESKDIFRAAKERLLQKGRERGKPEKS